jgi:predicted nucleic acid-binding Zn ribbon protein
MESLSKILENLLKKKRFGAQIQRHRVFENWEAVVGDSLAEHAQPQKIQGRTLILSVDHPAWIQELQFLKEPLIRKIQAAYPDTRIDNLRFVLNKV